MAPSGFMMDARRQTKTALEVHGHLQVRLHQQVNDTLVGYIEDPRLGDSDDIGALYYVVAVIFIYGLSIVMMIASHIRRNKQDCQLRAYLKEMALLRKEDRRDKLMGRITTIAATAKVKNVFKNADGPKKGLFRLGSQTSFKLGEARSQGGERAGGEGGTPVMSGSPGSRQLLAMKGEGQSDDLSRQEDGNETGDSEFLELPADFSVDLNRLSPSMNVSPLTSASATPSPPPRRELRAKDKICFGDEGFVL
ncbi:uncharacterized protein LOC143295247 [Babylonia areolata]|uniref:uncharacterized protein LOC143295247 n=1 Tax=Babylonia areolata TaxID=304850 RepID=UPI003FD5168B